MEESYQKAIEHFHLCACKEKKNDKHLSLLTNIISDFIQNIIPTAVILKNNEAKIPTYFRGEGKTKNWDIIVKDVHNNKTIIAIELKSLATSWSKNFNNRVEECIGSGFDLLCAIDELSVDKPYRVYLMIFFSCKESTNYLKRMKNLCKKITQKGLYDCAKTLQYKVNKQNKVVAKQKPFQSFLASIEIYCLAHLAKTLMSNIIDNKKTAIFFNGGKDSVVLLHLLQQIKQNFQIIFIENENEFPEIIEFVNSLNLPNIIKYKNTDMKTVIQNLITTTNLTHVFTGIRRNDPYGHKTAHIKKTDSDWPQVTLVNPLLNWTYGNIWSYIQVMNLKYCKLYDLGYTSLGSINNTVKNPALLQKDNTYLPACCLTDEKLERLGRK